MKKKHFERYDNWLDRCAVGPPWLQTDSIAQLVAKEIRELNGARYRLMTYCVMPNHVHVLIESPTKEQANHRGKSAKYPVTETLRLLQGRTARACNLERRRSGSFWQHESCDHVVREEQEQQRTVQYILNNPVTAGLVKEWKDWKLTYVNLEFGEW